MVGSNSLWGSIINIQVGVDYNKTSNNESESMSVNNIPPWILLQTIP